jgi:hypothetical protein
MNIIKQHQCPKCPFFIYMFEGASKADISKYWVLIYKHNAICSHQLNNQNAVSSVSKETTTG